MSNYYVHAAAERAIPCTEPEAQQIEDFLLHDAEESAETAEAGCGLHFEYDPKEGDGYLYGEEGANVSEMPDDVAKAIGRLVGQAGLPHLEIGVSFTCERCRPGSQGGTAYRLYPDGRLVEQRVFWPEDVVVLQEAMDALCVQYINDGRGTPREMGKLELVKRQLRD